MNNAMTATVVAAEFVSAGDLFDSDEDEPRPPGTYLTVRLDDDRVAVVSGKVVIEYLPKDEQTA